MYIYIVPLKTLWRSFCLYTLLIKSCLFKRYISVPSSSPLISSFCDAYVYAKSFPGFIPFSCSLCLEAPWGARSWGRPWHSHAITAWVQSHHIQEQQGTAVIRSVSCPGHGEGMNSLWCLEQGAQPGAKGETSQRQSGEHGHRVCWRGPSWRWVTHSIGLRSTWEAGPEVGQALLWCH